MQVHFHAVVPAQHALKWLPGESYFPVSSNPNVDMLCVPNIQRAMFCVQQWISTPPLPSPPLSFPSLKWWIAYTHTSTFLLAARTASVLLGEVRDIFREPRRLWVIDTCSVCACVCLCVCMRVFVCASMSGRGICMYCTNLHIKVHGSINVCLHEGMFGVYAYKHVHLCVYIRTYVCT